MTRAGIAALALALLALPPAQAATDNGAAMRAAADGFYGVYRTLHPSDGIPSEAVRAKLAPFVSPALGSLLEQAAGAEDRFAKSNKDSPPLAEGDVFTSLFEGATGVAVGACAGDSRSGHCAVALTYADPGGKPVTWTDTVELVTVAGAWRVDDVVYGGAWAFGNKGRLSETLKQVLAF